MLNRDQKAGLIAMVVFGLIIAGVIGVLVFAVSVANNADDSTRCDKNGWFTSDGKLYRCEQIKAINDAPVERGGKVNVN